MRIIDNALIGTGLELVWCHVAVTQSRRRHRRGELSIQCIVVEIETLKFGELIDLAGYRACDCIMSEVTRHAGQ